MQEPLPPYSFLDMGNSTVVLQHYTPLGLKIKRFLTAHFRSFLLEDFLKTTKTLFVCSVVPSKEEELLKNCSFLGIQVVFAQRRDVKDIQIPPMKEALGMDLLLQLEGAYAQHKGSLAVIALGTVTTITSVDKQGMYCGGVFMCGYKSQIKALTQGVGVLNSIKAVVDPKANTSLYHKQAAESLYSGTYWMMYYGLQGIIRELKKDTPEIKIFGTGGFGVYFKELFDITKEDLIFKGLRHIYNIRGGFYGG